MSRKIYVLKNSSVESHASLEEVLRKNGWDCEAYELSDGEPLPQSIENMSGLLIVGGPMNIYEQNTSPCLSVYFNS